MWDHSIVFSLYRGATTITDDPPALASYIAVTTRAPVLDDKCTVLGHECTTNVAEGTVIQTNTLGIGANAQYKGVVIFLGSGQCKPGQMSFDGCIPPLGSTGLCLRT